jgi:hypothetical protein
MFDSDIAKMKLTTDDLQVKDKKEKGNYFYVNDDLINIDGKGYEFYPPGFFISKEKVTSRDILIFLTNCSLNGIPVYFK